MNDQIKVRLCPQTRWLPFDQRQYATFAERKATMPSGLRSLVVVKTQFDVVPKAWPLLVLVALISCVGCAGLEGLSINSLGVQTAFQNQALPAKAVSNTKPTAVEPEAESLELNDAGVEAKDEELLAADVPDDSEVVAVENLTDEVSEVGPFADELETDDQVAQAGFQQPLAEQRLRNKSAGKLGKAAKKMVRVAQATLGPAFAPEQNVSAPPSPKQHRIAPSMPTVGSAQPMQRAHSSPATPPVLRASHGATTNVPVVEVRGAEYRPVAKTATELLLESRLEIDRLKRQVTAAEQIRADLANQLRAQQKVNRQVSLELDDSQEEVVRLRNFAAKLQVRNDRLKEEKIEIRQQSEEALKKIESNLDAVLLNSINRARNSSLREN